LVFDHLIESFQPFRDFLFRIRFRLQRKLQYSIVDFLRCHIDLCDLPADGCASEAKAFSFDVCEDSISGYFSPTILKMRAMTNRFFFQDIEAEFWPAEGV
jgi:hypothetical protein